MIRIVHIINDLGRGGAENMLYKILPNNQKTETEHIIISLKNEDFYAEKIREKGHKVYCLNINSNNIFNRFKKIKKIINQADLVDSWLYHSDLLAFIFAKIICKKKLIWNVRHSNLERKSNKFTTLLVVKLNSLISRKVDLIRFNSFKSKNVHLDYGYCKKRVEVIDNGFDLELLYFDLQSRNKLRKELLFTQDDFVAISVGRWDVQKDYPTLIKSISLAREKIPNIKLILIGNQLENSNKELMDVIVENNLNDIVYPLGSKSNIKDYLSAADVYISSSIGESFSNSIGEAMATELNCIVTDVGDSARIVGEHGYVVPIKNPEAIAISLKKISKYGNSRNPLMRKRVKENFEINAIRTKFEQSYEKLLRE